MAAEGGCKMTNNYIFIPIPAMPKLDKKLLAGFRYEMHRKMSHYKVHLYMCKYKNGQLQYKS